MRLARASIALVMIAAGLSVSGCEDPRPRADEIDRAVRGLLDEWVSVFAARDMSAVRSILAEDDRFVWLEDGEVRYPSAEAVVTALESFPPDLAVTYRLEGVRVLPVSDAMAWAHMSTRTEIRHTGVVVSEFVGVVSMLVEQRGDRWQIVAAHTSNVARRSDAGGR